MKWLFGRRDPKSRVLALLKDWHLFETVDLNRPELADKLRYFSSQLEQGLANTKDVITTQAQSGTTDSMEFIFDVLSGLPSPPEKLSPVPEEPDFSWEKAENGLGTVGRVVNRIRITFQAHLVSEYEKKIAESRRKYAPAEEVEQLKNALKEEISQIDYEFRTHLKNLLLLYQLYHHCLNALAQINSRAAEGELIKRLGATQPQKRLIALNVLLRRQFQPRTTEQALDYYIAQAKLLDRDTERKKAEKELQRLIHQTENFDELVKLIEPRLAEEGLIKLQSLLLERIAAVSPEESLYRYQEIITNPDEPAELKIAAIKATAELLLSVKPEPAVNLLVAALDDLETEVRVSAATALSRLPENTPKPARTTAQERLLFALRDGDLEVRSAAARSINPKTFPGADARLAQMLGSETNPHAREFAAIALGLNFPSTPQTTEALIKALIDEDATVRKAAAEALVAQRNIPTDHQTRLQFLCARQDWTALGNAGKAALDCLLPRLRDRKTEIRVEATRLLGKIRAREALHDLCIALSDSSQDVRKAAARALAEIGDPGAIAALKIAINREGFREVREEMERAVRKLS